MKALWQCLHSLRGQDPHQLFIGLKGLSLVKARIPAWDLDIGQEGTIVKGIKPIPTGYILIVIPAYPLQRLNILGTDTALKLQELLRLDPKLLRVVLFLVGEHIVIEGAVVIQVQLRGDSALDLLLEGAEQVVGVDAGLSLGGILAPVVLLAF